MESVYLCVTAATAQGLLQIDGLVVTAQLIEHFSAVKKNHDTRIFLHVNHISNTGASHINIFICSPDSAVLVRGCSGPYHIPSQMIWQTESRNQDHCINMTRIAWSIARR